MKIGIYNHWLSTLGGGEKVTAAMAEALSRYYQVDLITPEPISMSALEERINVSLEKVTLRVTNQENQGAWDFTQHYDLFINATHGSILPTQCRRNLLYVYFPLKLDGSSLLKRRLKAFLFRRFRYAHPHKGLYPAERYKHLVFRWTEPSASLKLPLPRDDHRTMLELSVRGYRPEEAAPARLRLRIGEDECTVLPDIVPAGGFHTLRVSIPDHHARNDLIDVEILTDGFRPAAFGQSLDARELGVMLGWMRTTNGPEPLHWLLARMFLNFDMRLQNQFELLASQLSLDRYQTICSVSRFTQKWVKRYWNRESELLYPPIDVGDIVPGEKRNAILTVGRFFDSHHNKKHFEMVQVFKEMCDQGLRGWELILVGGTHKEDIHREYLARLIKMSEGYPISILTDIPFARLRGLYGTSTIYWHATGFNEKEAKTPERFEHFGMSTVEAMAAGCIPVAIAKGGQLEIIHHGKNGLLWKRLDELRRYSLHLIGDEAMRRSIASAAVERSRHFSRQVFERNLYGTIERAMGRV
jgi:glycosyltransferase involved in cell wall biosynthesis